jgi:hypothetical protein
MIHGCRTDFEAVADSLGCKASKDLMYTIEHTHDDRIPESSCHETRAPSS